VHGVHQHQSFPDAALFETFLDVRGDVNKFAPVRHIEPEFFTVTFQVKPPLSLFKIKNLKTLTFFDRINRINRIFLYLEYKPYPVNPV
jgi:hypothetical protein